MDAPQICSFIYCGIAWIIVTPLLLWYLYHYYKLYKNGKMGVRKKHVYCVVTMETGIISLIAINRPLEVLIEFNDWHSDTTQHIGRAVFVLSFYAILTSLTWRTWILYYDMRLNQWQQNNAWKKIITP
eukprot:343966_1